MLDLVPPNRKSISDILAGSRKGVCHAVELLGTEVVPMLRREMNARRAPDVPDAPTHASLVKAKCGDGEPRQPRPNANRGDNLTGTSPYQDTDPSLAAGYPIAA
jgi:hypothetical protein